MLMKYLLIIFAEVLLSPAQVDALQQPSRPDPKSPKMLELVKTLKSSHAAAWAEFQAAAPGSPENASP